MTALAAAQLGYRCHICAPDAGSSAGQVAAAVTDADYGDADINNGGTRPVSGLPWSVNGDYKDNSILFLGLNASWL